MSALAITEKVCEEIEKGSYNLIRLNLANGDMVGHCGDFDATVQAIECLDACLEKLVRSCRSNNSILLITADHGNADEMYQFDSKKKQYKTKSGARVPSTSHSKNPVPFVVFDPLRAWTLCGKQGKVSGGIAQIGATLLQLTQLPVPNHYLPSLVKQHD